MKDVTKILNDVTYICTAEKRQPTMSIDCESNGLWGEIFSIAAILFDENGEVKDFFFGYAPLIDEEWNDWVKENVLPHYEHYTPTHESVNDMIKDFTSFYMKHKEKYTPLWHMGHVVETWLFRKMREMNLIGDFDAPYVPIEMAMLNRKGEKVYDSVDKYKKYLSLPENMTHHALYDALVAGMVYYLPEK